MEAPQIEKNNADNEEDDEVDEEEEDEEGVSTNGDKDDEEKTQLEGWDSSSICFINFLTTILFNKALMTQANTNLCRCREKSRTFSPL